jgi:hypothetical protein
VYGPDDDGVMAFTDFGIETRANSSRSTNSILSYSSASTRRNRLAAAYAECLPPQGAHSRIWKLLHAVSQKPALGEAERERGRLQNLQTFRDATAWLDARPQLGWHVFARRRRERDTRLASYMRLMEACLAVPEMEEAREQPALEQVYTPVVHVLFRIPDALACIRATLVGVDAPMKLTGFLPPLPQVVADLKLVARSAVGSTFFSVLELSRTAELVPNEGEGFEEVTCHVCQYPVSISTRINASSAGSE